MKKSKPTQTKRSAKDLERRPRHDHFGRLLDPGCPDWESCLEDAAMRNLACVPCKKCDKKF